MTQSDQSSNPQESCLCVSCSEIRGQKVKLDYAQRSLTGVGRRQWVRQDSLPDVVMMAYRIKGHHKPSSLTLHNNPWKWAMDGWVWLGKRSCGVVGEQESGIDLSFSTLPLCGVQANKSQFSISIAFPIIYIIMGVFLYRLAAERRL